MIPTLLVGTLAVTWGWEALRTICLRSLPSWLQPLIVLGLALIFTWPDWHLAAGIAGGSGIVHALLRDKVDDTAQAVRIRRGVGSRVPPLP